MGDHMNTVIEVRDLVREYEVKNKKKKEIKVAVKGISFDVKEGEVYGLLGPNGAGKTTTIKVLTTLLTPTRGEVKILGHDVVKEAKQIREQINFMFGGERGVYGRLTSKEYLQYFACLYQVPAREQKARIEELLELVELTDKRDSKIHTFSKGMIQRIQIARALVNNPRIVFLDEPTIGLDPVIADHIRGIVKNLAKEKISVILTTHYMKEADDLCNRIGIINDGQIKIIGSPQQIKDTCGEIAIFEATVETAGDEEVLAASGVFRNVKLKVIEGDFKNVRFEVEGTMTYEQVREELARCVQVINLQQKEITLEDAYINLVKEKKAG